MSDKPTFSILHTSARPEQWRAVFEDWLSKADNPAAVEYVLCIDSRWGFQFGLLSTAETFGLRPGLDRLTWNLGRMCYVDGVNTAAKASNGSILIVNADDQFPCEHWDTKLLEALKVHPAEFVLEVSTGTPNEHDRGILVLPILSRSRYERLGYVLYPEYESMFADNDFCEQAKQDGVILDARELVFPHRHCLFTKGVAEDRAYVMQNRPEAYLLGEKVLLKRRAANFGSVSRSGNGKWIAICIAGEMVPLKWAIALNGLTHGLRSAGWSVALHDNYRTSVYATRQANLESVLKSEPQPDYVLMFDDDNIVNFEHVARLLDLLESRPEVDAAAGWCWFQPDADLPDVRPSCGHFAPDSWGLRCFEAISFQREKEPREIEWTGFPCFLIRRSAFDRLPARPFLPLIDESLPYGMGGEDASFCKRAMDAGLKFLVDPRVKVQHIKPRAIEPVFPTENQKPPKVAAMLRVRNESRWISRVIRSLVPLCGENIYVLNDESTDETAALAYEAGATVYPDPFAGLPLDEARDKDWLTEKVVQECSPDWILCVDGDEELEPLGAEKIMGVLRQNLPVDCFALRFLYLWDSPDQARMDRWYRNYTRNSLFRAECAGFKSQYKEAGMDVNAGLHVSNAPAGVKSSALNVYLLHYGYMERTDRIRKYEYYNRIDPGNLAEDEYRHIAQGDLPGIPADAMLLHAGPLLVKKLPGALVPKDFAVDSALSGAQTKG